MNGYIEGFYDNKTESVGPQCMGQSTLESVQNFQQDLMSGNIMSIFQSFSSFYQAAYLIQTQCRFNEVTYQIMGYCLTSANGTCSFTNLQSNMMGSLFQITGALNFIVSDILAYVMITTVDISKLKEAKKDFQDLGERIGLIVRTVTGYSGTIGHPIKPIAPSSI